MPSPNPSRRPPGLPGSAPHERTPEERTATEIQRRYYDMQPRAVMPNHRARLFPSDGTNRLLEEQEMNRYLRSPEEMQAMLRQVDDGVNWAPQLARWTTHLPSLGPYLDEKVIVDATKMNQPRDVIEAAINSLGHKAAQARTLRSAVESPVPWAGGLRQHDDPRRESEYQQYVVEDQKRRLAKEFGDEVLKKCNAKVEMNYNRGTQRMTGEAIVFSAAEFDAFLRDMSANVIESIRQKGYIK